MIDKAFLSTDLFLLTLTVGLYCLGTAVYRRIRMPLLHPVLLTFVAVIVFLRAADIGYARYQEATGILDFALGMSVVALGYLLYEQVEQLRGSLLPVGIATLAGCVAGVLSVVYIAMAFGAGREILNSIAPKSVTVPIAVSVSGPLGGIVPVTSVVVFCVGIFGSIFGEWILRRCGVRDAEARGFALGAAAHGIGTARDGSRRRSPERAGDGPDGIGYGAADAADGAVSVLAVSPAADGRAYIGLIKVASKFFKFYNKYYFCTIAGNSHKSRLIWSGYTPCSSAAASPMPC